MEKQYWCGWEIPTTTTEEMDREGWGLAWPDGMIGWESGIGDGYRTWVGLVFAESAEAAETKVLSNFGTGADRIEMRWETEESDWTPEKFETNGRWPDGADWLRTELEKRR